MGLSQLRCRQDSVDDYVRTQLSLRSFFGEGNARLRSYGGLLCGISRRFGVDKTRVHDGKLASKEFELKRC